MEGGPRAPKHQLLEDDSRIDRWIVKPMPTVRMGKMVVKPSLRPDEKISDGDIPPGFLVGLAEGVDVPSGFARVDAEPPWWYLVTEAGCDIPPGGIAGYLVRTNCPKPTRWILRETAGDELPIGAIFGWRAGAPPDGYREVQENAIHQWVVKVQ